MTHHQHDGDRGTATAVLEVSGVQWASSKNVVEAVLSRRPGVLTVDASPVSQTAKVTYDPDRSITAKRPLTVTVGGRFACRTRCRST